MSTVMKNVESSERPGRRFDVLQALKAARTPLSIAEIAAALGVHPNTVRFHLDTLVEHGQVERAETDRRAPGRPPLLFRAARGMDPTGPREYRLLAEVLAHSLASAPDPQLRAVEAGRAWGRARGLAMRNPAADAPRTSAGEPQPVDRLVALLDELGFAPERRDDGGEGAVGLRHCPFLELAETTSTVVCPVHLGLMQGAMDAWRATLTVNRLDAFVEPDLCMAHLAPARAAS